MGNNLASLLFEIPGSTTGPLLIIMLPNQNSNLTLQIVGVSGATYTNAQVCASEPAWRSSLEADWYFFFCSQSYVITRLTLCILVVLFTIGLLNLTESKLKLNPADCWCIGATYTNAQVCASEPAWRSSLEADWYFFFVLRATSLLD